MSGPHDNERCPSCGHTEGHGSDCRLPGVRERRDKEIPRPKFFPVLRGEQRKDDPPWPRSVPWAMLAGQEAQAIDNHDQTLVRLAERGGLDPVEILCVLDGRSFKNRAYETNAEAIPELLRRVEAWEQAEAVPAAARDLLARIHGDGGHHMDAVGYEQAFRDAGERVVKERTEAAETAYRFSLQVTALTLEVERLRGAEDTYERGATEMRERAAECSQCGGLDGAALAASIAETIRALPVKPCP